MMFNDQVTGITSEVRFTAPSRWHIIYYLKWKLVIKPRLFKELSKAQASIIDDTLRPELLRRTGIK